MTLVLLAGAAAGPGASALERLLLGAWYMPHGHCYLWKPALVWLHVVSDLLIGGAYVLISVVLYALVRRIRLPFSGVIVAFGLFIGACGLTHFMEVWNTWYSAYWLAGGVKAVTAAASVATGVLLVRLRPTVVAVASAAQLSEQRREALEQKNRELEALYARLREADAHKTQFFANVSHELRTPLSLILGPVERLLTHDVSAAEQRADLQVVERNAQLLLRHVNALLDSAKLEAGQLRPDYAQVDLAELLRRVASNFELLSRERQVPLEVVAPRTLPAQVDAEKMERVLLNLLSNAFKFTPPGGRVRCVLEESGEGAWLAVEDSGPGVPESAREAIFERFRQAAAEGEVPQGGTGLGLAIARDFVQLHAGTLHVEGGALGGARFVTQLPLMAPGGAPVRPWPQRTTQASVAEARAATQLPAPKTAALAAAAGISGTLAPRAPLVLVVEDTAELRRHVAQLLGEHFQVAEAEDGEAGLQQAEALRPDLVITDLMMPRMTGDALVRALRARPEFDATPILLLSARADDALRAELLERGAQDYVVKPFKAPELLARVRNLTQMKRTRDVLEAELARSSGDLDLLAQELTQRTRQRAAALSAAQAAREEAERSSAFKGELLHLVSHELRTPLSVLQLNMHLLRRGREPLSERQLQVVDKLEQGVRRLLHLTEAALAYAELEAGQLRIRPAPVDVVGLVREVVQEQRPTAQRKLLALDAQLPEAPVVLRTDVRHLQLALTQLVRNALHYTERGGVQVSVEAREGQCRIQVRDSGPGIGAEDQERIFQPFEQLEAVAHKSKPGLGLGLPLVRHLVLALDGGVQLQSVPGQGSVFTLTLPLKEASGASAAG